MKKITFFAFLMLFVASIFAQTWESAPINNETASGLKSTNASGWTLQFSPMINTTNWGPGTAGIETDGTSIYIAKWASNKFFKVTTAGVVLDSFAVTGTPAFPASNGVRDLAYDGQYFYGCCNNNIIYKMDFTAKTIVGSITLPTGILGRHISYDPTADGGLGGFWVGGWSDNIVLYSRTGATLNTIPATGLGTFSAYGSAFDSVSPGGPYLWLYSQTGTNGNQLIQVKIATKLVTGLTHDVCGDIPGSAVGSGSGGCFLKTNLITGTTTIGGLIQGTAFWGYNLASTIPPTFGLSVKSLNLQSIVLTNSVQTLAGVLNNYGATALTSFALNYSINNGAAVTQNVTGLNVASYADYNYSHTTPWTVPATAGTYTVKLWASNVNGNSAWYSDTITKSVSSAATVAYKKVLLEEYTGIYCQYCPDGHKKANDYKALHPNDVFVINIHQGSYANQTGSDPNFKTSFGDALAAQTGLTGYPAATVNRHVFSPATVTATSDRAAWPTMGDQILATPTYANATVTASVNYTTRLLTVNTTANYIANGPALNMMNVALIQNNVEGPQTGAATWNPGQVLPNGKYNHGHMLRHLLTGQWGDSITVTTSGTVRTKTYTYTLPASINSVNLDIYNIEVIAFVTEGKQEVITGAEFKLPTSITEVTNGVDFNVYPNPATENMQVNFNLTAAKKVDIQIYNNLGVMVYSSNEGQMTSGEHAVEINVSDLAKGIYFLRLKAGENNIAKKIVIQ
ncbi:MAG: Omp28-related outer membrane protein [Bacteroidales bacterium]